MKSTLFFNLIILVALFTSCDTNKNLNSTAKNNAKMELKSKEKAVALIKSLETGDQIPVSYINPNKYIQHKLTWMHLKTRAFLPQQ